MTLFRLTADVELQGKTAPSERAVRALLRATDMEVHSVTIRPRTPCKYGIYDHDAQEWATTQLYDTIDDARADADELNNCIVVATGIPLDDYSDDDEVDDGDDDGDDESLFP